MSAANLHAWLSEISYPVPEDLLALWATVGSGELFESEEVFAPDGTADDLRNVAEDMAERGMPAGLTVFHRGTWVSAIDHTTGELVAFNEVTVLEPYNYVEIARFATLDEWYGHLILAELGERYGLVPQV